MRDHEPAQSQTDLPTPVERIVEALGAKLQWGLNIAGFDAKVIIRGADLAIEVDGAYVQLRSTNTPDDPDWLVCARGPVRVASGSKIQRLDVVIV